MRNTLFENKKLLRDSIITWILVFNYPFIIYGIIRLFGGEFDFGTLFLMSTPVILIMLLHAIRAMRTNTVSISTRMNGSEIEVAIRTLFGKQVIYNGWKSEFEIRVISDKWNRGHPFLEIWFRGEKVARQFHIAFRGKKWMQGIVDAWRNTGLKMAQ
jgi:hypothetical protein